MVKQALVTPVLSLHLLQDVEVWVKRHAIVLLLAQGCPKLAELAPLGLGVCNELEVALGLGAEGHGPRFLYTHQLIKNGFVAHWPQRHFSILALYVLVEVAREADQLV